MADQADIWAGRFTVVTFILGGIAGLVLAVLLLGNILARMTPPNYALGPASARIVAGGGAGTWFVMGLLSFLLTGIVGLGMSALFYQYLETSLRAPIAGWRTIASWVHLLVGGSGAAAASLLMTYGGYTAGIAALDTDYGGWEQGTFWIHTNVLGPLVLPIAALMGLALLGYLVGGIGILTQGGASRAT